MKDKLCQCGKPLKFKSRNVPRKTCGDYICRTKLRGPLSEETKEKLRTARLSFMKNHPEKTAWRLGNVPSWPERFFESAIKRAKLAETFLIIRERSVFPYFIDFAFEDIKVAVEIDGAQHKNEQRKANDEKKDAVLHQEGWRIFRINASKLYSEQDADSVVADFLEFIQHEQTSSRKCCILTGREFKAIKTRDEAVKKDLEREQHRLEIFSRLSSLDFSGRWTQDVSKILGIVPGAVRRYLRREFPALYYDRCRKGTHVANFGNNKLYTP